MVRIFQLYFCVTILCLSAGFSRAADSHYTNFQLATEIDPLKQQAEITRLTDKASVSLDDLLKAAILLNPVIAAAQNDIGAAKGRLRQAGQYVEVLLRGLFRHDKCEQQVDRLAVQ